jgi:flagellar export protein FliJ
MAFHFALAPLLRLRHSLERQRALALQAANLQVARGEERLAQLDRVLLQAAQSQAEGLASGCSAAELQFNLLQRETRQGQRLRLVADLRGLEQVRERVRHEYHQAYRDREVLEILQAGQRRQYLREQLRRQQQDLDAAFLLQRWHRPDERG